MRATAERLLAPEFTTRRNVDRLPTPYQLTTARHHAGIAVQYVPYGRDVCTQAFAQDRSSFPQSLRRALAPLHMAAVTKLAPDRIRSLIAIPIDLHAVDNGKFHNKSAADSAHIAACALIFLLYRATLIDGQQSSR